MLQVEAEAKKISDEVKEEKTVVSTKRHTKNNEFELEWILLPFNYKKGFKQTNDWVLDVHVSDICSNSKQNWITAIGSIGSNIGKWYFESWLQWSFSNKWNIKNKRRGYGLLRVGFGTKDACSNYSNSDNIDCVLFCGRGYIWHNGRKSKFESQYSLGFMKSDTVQCGVDFQRQKIFFGVNGRISHQIIIPPSMQRKPLYPMFSIKATEIGFNFGSPQRVDKNSFFEKYCFVPLMEHSQIKSSCFALQ